METVIKELTQKLKDFKHWERLALMKGENKKADQYGKYAKEYQQAINVLCEGKAVGTSEKDLRACEVNDSNLSKHEKKLNELAEILMQSESLSASVEILREFAGECYEEGVVDAQNEACREIR